MRALTCLVLSLWVAPAAQAQDAVPPQTVALVGATVMTGEGEPIEHATVLIRDGSVLSVGTAPVPAGARVIDCAGTTITPGFVSTQSQLGLVEIGLEAATADHAVEGDDADPVRASFAAIDGYNPTSTLIPVARRWGVTSVVSTPSGGLISGTSAWMDLAGRTLDDVLVRETTALHASLGDAAVESAGGARSAALNLLREVFADAQLYRQRGAQYDRRGLRELRVSRLDLERLSGALAGDFPVVIAAARSSDILRALAFASQHGLRLVIAGGEEAWMVAPQLAAADVPVIVRPMTNLPANFSQIHARYDNAAILHRAGVRLILSTDGPHGQRNLRQQAGNAIATGLPRDAALRALTLEPARVFGVDDQYGTLAPGRVANLVVWTGDPFELTTWARQVFIRGREIPTTSRQSLLFDRYRRLENVPRGQRGLPRSAPPER